MLRAIDFTDCPTVRCGHSTEQLFDPSGEVNCKGAVLAAQTFGIGVGDGVAVGAGVAVGVGVGVNRPEILRTSAMSIAETGSVPTSKTP